MSNLFDYIREARRFRLRHIGEVAGSLGIPQDSIELYGRYKAKVPPSCAGVAPSSRKGRYVIVTAVTPTKFGEGKTLNTIGISMALNRLGKKAVACLRQPSLGPLFGVKGGATGGGKCQVIPPEDINFFLTGDFPAIETCHNLIAAFTFNHIYYGKTPKIERVLWRRVIDMNDRTLRRITHAVGKAGDFNTGFDLTPASEVMAIVALASSYEDLLARLERIIVGVDESGAPVTTKDIGAAGPSSVLLRKAFWPNLLQTSESTPVMIHAGPFGNIAHGNSSILADLIALGLCDFVITEAGFGAELGFEKFIDIKCRVSGLWPDCAVVVVTLRAVKEHGLDLLMHTIAIVKMAGVPCVVAVNKFEEDSEQDVKQLRDFCLKNGADACEGATFFRDGGAGGTALAEAVVELSSRQKQAGRYFYSLDTPVEERIRTLARKLYLAEDVEFSPKAVKSIKRLRKWGFDRLPVCIAKNHLSLSHDPNVKGIPKPYKFPVSDVDVRAGAGYIYVLSGDILTLPGLPDVPPSVAYSLDSTGDFKF